jgi:polysaccharide deacetylase family protein (PEP-CTERM system associated)
MEINSTAVNFLTVDLEEWFHVNYPGVDLAALAVSRSNLPELTDRLLALFGKLDIRCSFFILGSVAEKYPTTIRRIKEAGHEIASHGFGHASVYQMSVQELRSDLLRTSDILESITGSKVLGFRAPSFSITREILPWYYETLEELGYKYSSSVFVGRTFLYGIPDFPYRIHTPSGDGWRTQIVEFPITKVNLGFTAIPLYLRLFPARFITHLVRSENAAGRPSMLYLHPREIDPEQPRLPLTKMQSVIHYFGVAGCERKLQSILGEARFTTIEDFLAKMGDRSGAISSS